MMIWKQAVGLVVLSASAWAMPLGTSMRSVIPSDLQQLISVDYRALHDSPTAQQLKQQVLPQSLKQFETALKGIGIDADRDVDQLTFAAYRQGKTGIRTVGMAQGSFQSKTVLKRMTVKKIKPIKYRTSDIYSMGNGMMMTFLDDNTLLFGDDGAVKGALDARDGVAPNFDSASTMVKRWLPTACGSRCASRRASRVWNSVQTEQSQ